MYHVCTCILPRTTVYLTYILIIQYVNMFVQKVLTTNTSQSFLGRVCSSRFLHACGRRIGTHYAFICLLFTMHRQYIFLVHGKAKYYMIILQSPFNIQLIVNINSSQLANICILIVTVQLLIVHSTHCRYQLLLLL